MDRALCAVRRVEHAAGGSRARRCPGQGWLGHRGRALKAQAIEGSLRKDSKRLSTGMLEVNAVLGGGIVLRQRKPDSRTAGIGKSTLLLQLANLVAQQNRVLYVSGEESEYQVGLRAQRLGAGGSTLKLVASTSADDVAVTIMSKEFDLVVVDSIQTMSMQAVASAPGSVSQITNSTAALVSAAKQSGTAVIIVGHVTKEGNIAGPKLLEHIVDVVLQLEATHTVALRYSVLPKTGSGRRAKRRSWRWMSWA